MTSRRWFKLSLAEQMANIGAEVGRTISWKSKNKEYSQLAFYRALELLTLTKSDPKNKIRLSELCRVYELLGDWFLGNALYRTDDAGWEKYFYAFNYACRRTK